MSNNPILPKKPKPCVGKPEGLKTIPTLELLEEIADRAEIERAYWSNVAEMARLELARLELSKEGSK